jgi:Phospholipid methyltransferase
LIPLIYSLTSWLDFTNYRWSPATKARVGSIGTVWLGATIWLFWRSHRDLGKNWSPSLEISAQQTLITHGVYRTIPHPMYASGWLLSLAQALLLQNWVAGPAGVVAHPTTRWRRTAILLRSMAVAHRRRSAAAINRSAATKGAQMLRGLTTVNFWAADMAAAKKCYTELLGFGPYFERPPGVEPPQYAEWRLGNYQHELGLIDRKYSPAGSATGPGGVVVYW